MSAGLLSKANNLLLSKGLADITDPRVVAQLNKKHGPRQEPMSAAPPAQPHRLELSGRLRKRYKGLKREAGTGVGNYRNEYLTALTNEFSDEYAMGAIPAHEFFGELYLNGDLPAWFYWCSSIVKIMAIVKKAPAEPNGVPDVRPVGMGDVRRRAWTCDIVNQVKNDAGAFLFPQQVAIGVPAGLQLLILGVRLHMQEHPDHDLVKLDFSNAFNEFKRSKATEAFIANPFESIRNLALPWWLLMSPAALIDGIDNLSDEGGQQGCPLAALAFCLVIHEHIVWADEQLQRVGGGIRMDMDDGYAFGPRGEVFRVVHAMTERLAADVGLRVNSAKCDVYAATEESAAAIDAFLALPANSAFATIFKVGRDSDANLGITVSGEPLGTAAFRHHFFDTKTSTIESDINKLASTLRYVSSQSLMCLLVYCAQPRLHYHMQNNDPDELRPYIRRVDTALSAATLTATMVDTQTVDAFTRRRFHLPRRLRGTGLRSLEQVAPAAFIGSALLCMPRLIDSTVSGAGFMPSLTDLFGAGSFDPGNEATRFQTMLASPSATSAAFRRHWKQMALTAQLDLNFPRTVDDDLTPLPEVWFLSAPVQAAGTLLVPGLPVLLCRKHPQKQLTLEREQAILDSLTAEVSTFPSDDKRRMAFLSVDKFGTSMHFCGSWPSKRHIIDNDALHEAYATAFGLPSPRCRPLVGRRFRKQYFNKWHHLDAHGIKLLTLPLDGRRKWLHDHLKWMIKSFANQVNADLRAEVMDLFSPHISQLDTFLRDNDERTRQGMIPDFLFTAEGNRTLLDVKTLAGPSAYSASALQDPRARCTAVEVRAAAVHRDCILKARKLDENYNQVPRFQPGTICGATRKCRTPGCIHHDSGRVGPVWQRLKDYGHVNGLVIGCHSECSTALHDLLKSLAEIGAAHAWREMGASDETEACAVLLNEFRRTIGIAATRHWALLKLDRLDHFYASDATSSSTRRQTSQHAHTHWDDMYYTRHGPDTFRHGPDTFRGRSSRA